MRGGRQPDLFRDLDPAIRAPEPALRAATLDGQITLLLRHILSEDGRPRAEIAAALSETLGRTISVATLDAWTSQAKGQHRIPLDAAAALIDTAAGTAIIAWLAERAGLALVPKRYAGLVELQLVRERREELERREQLLTAQWRSTR